jgi:hypothetical protein
VPRYDVKCSEGHYSEIFQNISEFKSDHTCKCGQPAHIVIKKPAFFNVDNVDKVDYTVSAGQNFSNRRERDAWLKANNAYIMGEDSTVKDMFSERKKMIEEVREVEARGKSWQEHLFEKRQQEIADKEARMKAAGVSITTLTKEEQAAVQWSDTVNESDYMSKTLRGVTPDGTKWAKAEFPKEPVPEPFFD